MKFLLLSSFILLAVTSVIAAAATFRVPSLTQGYTMGCSGTKSNGMGCCSGALGCTSTSSLTISKSSLAPTAGPFNISQVDGCNGWRCQCYDSNGGRGLVDFSAVAQKNVGASLKVHCLVQGCAGGAGQIVRYQSLRGTDGVHFPAPFVKDCNSNTSMDCYYSSSQKVIQKFPTQDNAAKITITPDMAKEGLLLSVSPVVPASCQIGPGPACAYGGSAFSSVVCTVGLE